MVMSASPFAQRIDDLLDALELDDARRHAEPVRHFAADVDAHPPCLVAARLPHQRGRAAGIGGDAQGPGGRERLAHLRAGVRHRSRSRRRGAAERGDSQALASTNSRPPIALPTHRRTPRCMVLPLIRA
jgi:hypothetical protein